MYSIAARTGPLARRQRSAVERVSNIEVSMAGPRGNHGPAADVGMVDSGTDEWLVAPRRDAWRRGWGAFSLSIAALYVLLAMLRNWV